MSAGKKTRFDLKGMKFNIWFYFAMYAFFIILLLWLFQVVLLEPFYTGMKRKEVIRLGDGVLQEMGAQEDIAVYARSEELKAAAAANDVSILFFNAETLELYGQMLLGEPQLTAQDVARLVQEVEAGKNGRVTYLDTGIGGKENFLVYGASQSEWYLYIRAALAPVGTTSSVLKMQLFVITLILLAVGFFVAWMISARLAKPLAKISREAQKLGRGDYDVAFPEAGYTEIDELANTLNYAAGELKKTDELRKELMANVSHDLRTPLTMVKAYAEMIRDISGDNKAKREQHANVIIEEADRLSTLVSDILNLSRLERGAVTMQREDVSLSDTVEKVLAHLSVLQERDGYRFTATIEPNVYVHADATRMEQVVYNLISNAVNYTGEDKSVTVRLVRRGAVARFEVTDTGAGIPKEQQQDIWQRYYRSKETHKRPVVGTGLGLSIVKGLLTAHGARFGVESEVGHGSTFWFEMDTVEKKIGQD